VHFFIEAVKEVDHSIECIGSSSAIDALRLLKNQNDHQPDYIFLDLNMPRMNGKECLSEIKKTKSLFQIPVFVFTTSNREDATELQRLGAAQYFVKPGSFKELLRIVKEVLASE